jgi:hypothetical protein
MNTPTEILEFISLANWFKMEPEISFCEGSGCSYIVYHEPGAYVNSIVSFDADGACRGSSYCEYRYFSSELDNLRSKFKKIKEEETTKERQEILDRLSNHEKEVLGLL